MTHLLASTSHGYLLSSGLPTLFGDYVQSCTVEGDNYLLTQQTTRYLLKAYQQGREGKTLVGNARYLEKVDALLQKKCAVQAAEGFLDPAVLIEAYQHRASVVIHQTATLIAQEVSRGKSFEAAWNCALVEISRASRAHCFLTILISFMNGVEAAKKTHPELHLVLQKLQNLFALYYIEENLGEFTEAGYFSATQVAMVRAKVRQLLEEVRPDAIPLVDAFNISDYELHSALGRYDGKVYEALFEMAQQEPLNKEEVVSEYAASLRPMFKREGIFKKSAL